MDALLEKTNTTHMASLDAQTTWTGSIEAMIEFEPDFEIATHTGIR